jgi:hypothetical protein
MTHRQRLIALLGGILLLGSIVWTTLWQPIEPLPTNRGDRPALETFALEVASRTPPGCSIFFQLPAADADGGLANHRLRYLLGPRYVATNLDEVSPPLRRIDFIAIWRDGHSTLEATH